MRTLPARVAPRTASAETTTASATAAVAAATTTTESATTAAPSFLRTRLVDVQFATFEILLIKRLTRRPTRIIVGHLDKREAA